MNDKQYNNILLITTTDIETKAMLKKLKDIKEIEVNGIMLREAMYDKIPVTHLQLPVQGSIGVNNPSIILTKVFSAKRFKLAILIGTAFGGDSKIQKIGDVLISSDIYNPAISTKGQNLISSIYFSKVNPSLQMILRKYVGKKNSFKSYFGTYICTSTVIKDSTTRDLLCKSISPWAIGGDMESFSFANSCESNNVHYWIVIKGISDFAEGNILNQNRSLATNNALQVLDELINNEDDINKILNFDKSNDFAEVQLFPLNVPDDLECKYETTYHNNATDINIIPRETLSIELINQLDEYGTVNLSGLALSGKTTLANIISKKYEKNIYISLKSLQEQEIIYLFNNLIFNLEKYKNCLIVIDDVKYYRSNSLIRKIIDNFLNIAKSKEVYIIIISNRKLPNFSISISCSNVSNNDVIEFLKLYNAPKIYFEPKKIAFILGASNSEISKLEILIKYMSSNNWNINNEIIEKIINGDYCRNLNDEVQMKLLEELDSDSKELLYRISFSLEPLNSETILKIANIEPKIKNPNEAIIKLKDIWITELGDKNFKTSNFINCVVKDNVELKIKNEIYKTLANSILTKKNLTPYDVQNLLIYLKSCKDYNTLVYIYTSYIGSMIKNNIKYDNYLISSFWKDIDLPDGMDNFQQLGIRTMQIYFYYLNDIECEKTVELTYNLILKEKFPELLLLPIVGFLLKLSPLYAYKIIRHVIENRGSVNTKYNDSANRLQIEIEKLNNPVSIEALIIMSTTIPNFADFFDEWINLIKCMNSDDIDRLLNCNILNMNDEVTAKELFCKAIDGQWIYLDKTKDVDKVQKLINTHNELLKFSKKISNEFLISISLKCILILESEYLDNRENALKKFEIEISNFKDEKEKNQLYNSIGQQYWYDKKYNQAIFWLEKSSLTNNTIYEISDNIWSKIMLCDSYYNVNSKKSVKIINSILKYLKITQLPSSLKLMFYTEIMIRAYYDNCILNYVDIYNESIELILKDNLVETNYNLIRMFIHCFNFFYTDVVYEKSELIENTDYINPYTRIMLKEFPEKRDLSEIDIFYQILRIGIDLNIKINNLNGVLLFVKKFNHYFIEKPGYYFLFNETVERYLAFNGEYEMSMQFCLNRIFAINRFSKIKNYKDMSLENMQNLEKFENSVEITSMILSSFGIYLLSSIVLKKYSNEKVDADYLISFVEQNTIKTEERNLFVNIIREICNENYKIVFEQIKFYKYTWLYYINNFIISLANISDMSIEAQLNCLKTLISDSININIYNDIINVFIEQLEVVINNEHTRFLDEDLINNKINIYKETNNLKNLKQIYIEFYKQIGFNLSKDTIEWLKN